MGFLNSLNEIAKNRNNFPRWEQEQKDKIAQREALQNKKEATPEEIERAKELGENIISAIDVMDNHSESVAENVETVSEVGTVMATYLGLGASAFGAIKFGIIPASEKIHVKKKEFLQSKEVKDLVQEVREHYKDTVDADKFNHFSEYDILYRNSYKEIDNKELVQKISKLKNNFKKSLKPEKLKMKTAGWGIAAGTIASFVAATVYGASVQVNSSKIARFQARKALENPMQFVNYTPEQIAQAKAEIEADPRLKNKKFKENEKLKQGFFKSIKDLIRDRKAYDKAKKLDKFETKLVTRPLTPQEIAQAERDRDVIQRTVKIINNEAEKNSENMEVAAGVILGTSPILGATIGGALKFVLEKTGFLNKVVQNNIDKNGSEETKKLYQEYIKLADNKNKKASEKIKMLRKFWDFAESFNNDLYSSTKDVIIDNAKHADKKPKVALTKEWGRKFTITMANRTTRGWAIAGIGAALTGFAGLILSLKLQKSASRAGRYNAKRDLEKDPRNFIGYSQEEYKQVEHIKSTQKDQSKIKEYAMFIPNVLKQYYAYNKYRSGEYQQKQLLKEQLMKQEVSQEQLTDAKNLQRKVFNTFEKVDDNSQTYSESMEAAIEIAQPFVMYGSILATLAPFIYYGKQMANGRKKPADLIKKISTLMKNSSKFMKTKLYKNYLKSIEKHIPNVVEKTEVKRKPIGMLLEGVNLQEDSIVSILNKTFENLRKSPDELRKLDSYELNSFISKAKNLAGKETDLYYLLEKIQVMQHDSKINMLDVLLNPKKIETMKDVDFKSLINDFEHLATFKHNKILNQNKLAIDKISELKFKIETSNINNKELLEELCSKLSKNAFGPYLSNVKKIALTSKINSLTELFENPQIENIVADVYGDRAHTFYKYLQDVDNLTPDIRTILNSYLENIPVEKLKTLFTQYKDDIIKIIGDGDYQKLSNILNNNNLSDDIYNLILNKENAIKLIKLYEKVENVNILDKKLIDYVSKITNLDSTEHLKVLPDLLGKYETSIKKLINEKEYNELVKYLNDFINNPEQTLGDTTTREALQKIMKKLNPIDAEQRIYSQQLLDAKIKIPESYQGKFGLKLDNEGKITVDNLLKDLIAYKDKQITKIKDPKVIITTFKDKISKMSDDDFNKLLSKTSIDIDKKTIVEILGNCEKIIDNIPKEETQQIFRKMLEEFNRNPDQFIATIKSGKAINFFKTPELMKALKAAGIAWTTFAVVITYALESWLAELQLKAGRLGVMKSLEDLSDPRYYANIEKV